MLLYVVDAAVDNGGLTHACFFTATDIEVGFDATGQRVSEGDGLVNVTMEILEGGSTEQTLKFKITYNPLCKNFLWSIQYFLVLLKLISL